MWVWYVVGYYGYAYYSMLLSITLALLIKKVLNIINTTNVPEKLMFFS